MKRNVFLKTMVPVSVLSYLTYRGFKDGWFQRKTQPFKPNGKKIVLIQLDGGNDGLNTVVPLDKYSSLFNARKNLMIPESKVLALKGSSVTGLHPAMTELQELHNHQQTTIIQGVGYPNPDLSHFKSIDIWHSGGDSSATINTGWVGRFLDEEYRNYFGGKERDPPAIQIGPSLSKIFQGPEVNMGMAVQHTTNFYGLVIDDCEPAPLTSAGHELSFFRNTTIASKGYWKKVKGAAKAQKNLSALYPAEGKNPLADQLKIAAQLIGGGLETKVYMVNLKGFDTHDAQVDSADTTKGNHADLLAQLSTAIAAFEDDLRLMGKADDVLGMTYSEFGRRIKSNSNYGCDHGTAAPVILFSTKLKGGIIGQNPEVPAKAGVEDNLLMQYDYRSVYSSVLKGWFGVTDKVLAETLLAKYPAMDLFKA